MSPRGVSMDPYERERAEQAGRLPTDPPSYEVDFGIVCVDSGLCDLCGKRPAFGIPLCEKCVERLSKRGAS